MTTRKKLRDVREELINVELAITTLAVFVEELPPDDCPERVAMALELDAAALSVYRAVEMIQARLAANRARKET